jgi:two-component system, LuxR family, response regulator FixJ
MVNPRVAERDVYIADGDLTFRSAVASSLETQGYHVTLFSDGPSLLAATRHHVPGCILLDADVSGPTGNDILGELGQKIAAPIVIMADDANIDMAVSAMKKGAKDFMVKPMVADAVAGRVCQALAEKRPGNNESPNLHSIPGGERLTPREKEVLQKISAGASNKEAGRQLGISPRTVEVHRARIMEKIGARNTADLVRIVYSASF